MVIPMIGEKVISKALEHCGVERAIAVIGYPITELGEALVEKFDGEWAVNEKTAFEIGLGNSVNGVRSCVVVKHVGMNVLSDPLITSTIHTIGHGLVVLVGDDPGAIGSQNEQDSRYYGLLADVPVFDPNPETLFDSIVEAYRISEATKCPSIVRLTERLLRAECSHKGGRELQTPEGYDRNIWEYSVHERHMKFIRERYQIMIDFSENTHLNVVKGNYSEENEGKVGIISTGYTSQVVDSVVDEDVVHVKLSVVNPLPLSKISYVENLDRVLVVEETSPFVERQLSTKFLGRRSGHIQNTLVDENEIRLALDKLDMERVEWRAVKSKEERGNVCMSCPFIPLFKALKRVDVPVAGDVGCIYLTAHEPWKSVDVAFVLGSAIGVACGFEKGVAVMGDFGFMHSGIQSLVHAVSHSRDLVIVIMLNKVAGISGRQPFREAEYVVDIAKTICKDTTLLQASSTTEEELFQIISSKIKGGGVSVIVLEGSCPETSSPYQ